MTSPFSFQDGCPYSIPGWARLGPDREFYLGSVGPSTWYESEATAKEEGGPGAFLAEIESEAENQLLRIIEKCKTSPVFKAFMLGTTAKPTRYIPIQAIHLAPSCGSAPTTWPTPAASSGRMADPWSTRTCMSPRMLPPAPPRAAASWSPSGTEAGAGGIAPIAPASLRGRRERPIRRHSWRREVSRTALTYS